MDTRIRLTRLDDLPHILHHRRAMFEEMGYRDPAVLDRMDDHSEQYFREALRTGAYTGWLAEDSGGRIIAGGGVMIASWPGFPGETSPERAWILNMYTEPSARRQGLAKQILTEILEWCAIRGFRTVSLHASNAGRSLYESVGFQPTNEMRFKF